MSLERGVTLWRLNQELFPDPGNPMARTTVPFEARGGASGLAAAAPGVWIAGGKAGWRFSPPPSAARIAVPFWTRASWLDGTRFRGFVPIRLRIWRRPRFNFRFGGFWFG